MLHNYVHLYQIVYTQTYTFQQDVVKVVEIVSVQECA